MRQIRDVMRLRYGEEAASERVIARRLGIGRTTVHDYLERIEAAGLGWPLPEELSDSDLEACLFGRAFQPSNRLGVRQRAEPAGSAYPTRRRFASDEPSRYSPFQAGSRDYEDPHNRIASDRLGAYRLTTDTTVQGCG